jgi:L-malate glycosyltransferase
MKPLHITHLASGDLLAGAEIMLLNLAQSLQSSDEIKLTVILLNYGELEKRLINNHIHTIVFDEQKYSSLAIFLKLTRYLRENRPNLLHTHRIKENIIGSMAAKIASPKIKSIRTIHGAPECKYRIINFRQNILHFLDIFTAKYIQELSITVSEDLEEKYSRHIADNKILTIENGINFPDIEECKKARLSWPGPYENIKVSFIGRLNSVKRVDIFIELAKYTFDHKLQNYSFYIFGDGPLSGDVRHSLSDLPDNFYIYQMGFKENIHEYLCQSDILVITSDHEGLPISALEAISYKVPIIAHGVGGIPKLLGNGEYGTILDSQSIKKLFKHLVSFSKNKRIFMEKSDKAYLHARKNYSIDRCTFEYINLYKLLSDT